MNVCSAASLRRLIIIATLIVIGCGLIGVTASGAAPVAKKADPPIVAKCKADLAKRFKLQAGSIKLIESQPVIWPDAALGLPEAGKAYAYVETPGFRIILEAKNSRYLYTASATSFRYGGPVDLWSLSLLHTKPIPDEANLNEDLYQCSMLGTSSVLLFSGVESYYPQLNRSVIVERRTSRSGQELLYFKASDPKKVQTLYGAFAFGSAAANSAGTEWAAFIRPGLGSGWHIVVGKIGEESHSPPTLPLPEGIQAGQIAWSGENVQILARDGERAIAFEISPKAASPAWKPVPASDFPGMPDYMLNKSESLDISQITEDGKTFVDVATVWFTGDRKPIARIPGMTLSSYDFLGGRYVFVTGEQNSRPVSYTVDIHTDELIPGLRGAGRNIKVFQCPLRSTPLVKSDK